MNWTDDRSHPMLRALLRNGKKIVAKGSLFPMIPAPTAIRPTPKNFHAYAICLGTLLLAWPVFGQSNSGRILGSVTDQSGGVIANATVIVTDVQRGVARTLATDQDGQYAAPNLAPITYSVRAEVAGFRKVDREGILLQVGQDIRVDLTLQTGQQLETITVTGDVLPVDATSATLGGTLSNQIINDLPLNGRNYENLLSLRPGVTIYPGGGVFTQSTNGLHADGNVYLLDGQANDSPWEGQSMING